jgi:Ca2+-binding RTX toxin-like protein
MPLPLLKLLAGRRDEARRLSQQTARRRALLRYESLEDRQLLAASFSYNAATRVLTVTGTESADIFVLNEVSVGGTPSLSVAVSTGNTTVTSSSYPTSSIERVVMNGLGGDDRFSASASSRPLTLDGGAGNDLFFGGQANDLLIGGSGDDRMGGGPGNDTYRFSGSSNLGTDTLIDAAAEGADTLDFASLAQGVSIDLANNSTTQTVAPGLLSLKLEAAYNLPANAESLENVVGTPYADTIRGNARFNSLTGSGGNDVLEGRGGDDVLNGGSGDDTYVFGASGYLGADTIVESSGSDTLDFSSYGQTVVLDLANTSRQDVKSYFPNDDVNDGNTRLSLTLPSSIEIVRGSQSKDWILGNALANTLYGNGGDDVLEGRAGNDTLDGGAGNDTYRYTGGTSNLGSDSLVESTGGGTDVLDFSSFSLGVTVNLASTGAPQTVVANRLSLQLSSGAFENVVGSAYADTIRGNDAANVLSGGVGNDVLEGRGGNDRLEGGQGDDTYVFTGAGNLGTDTIVEDDDSHGPSPDSHDKLDFSTLGGPISLNLGNSATQTVRSGLLKLVLTSASGIEDVAGTEYADTITGNARNNTLRGNGGNDTIYGGSGSDSLFGGAGDDLLYGESGADTLYGEAGKDRLSGGIDGAIDLLYGGADADIFLAEWYDDSATKTRKNRDRFMDLSTAAGDTSI